MLLLITHTQRGTWEKENIQKFNFNRNTKLENLCCVKKKKQISHI